MSEEDSETKTKPELLRSDKKKPNKKKKGSDDYPEASSRGYGEFPES